MKPTFAVGFLTGQEIDWLPHATSALRDELPSIEVRIVSNYSPVLADDLEHARLDVAFMRRENRPELEFKVVATEPLVVILPSDHQLAAKRSVDPRDLAGKVFVGISDTAPVLRDVIRAYLRRNKLKIVATHEIDNLAMAMSMIASTRGIALLPLYAEKFMPSAVTSRPLVGEPPRIELVVGYHRGNTSPVLKTFLERIARR